MQDRTDAEKKTLHIVSIANYRQEDYEGGRFNPANQSVALRASGEATRARIMKLVDDELLVPSAEPRCNDYGFAGEIWCGYPGATDIEGHPLGSKEATMAAKAKKEETEKVEKKAKARSRAKSLEGLGCDDFFNVTGEGEKQKSSFKPGYDAKLAAMFKRVIAGKADEFDTKLMKDKGLMSHAKVEGSDHLRGLRDEAKAA